ACTTLDWHFFFQAEDGIRDFHVTGVQTCALPICPCPKILIVVGQWLTKTLAPGTISPLRRILNLNWNLPLKLLQCESIVQRILRSEERRVGKEWSARGGMKGWKEKGIILENITNE